MELKAKVIQILPVEVGVSKAGNQWQKATLIAEYGNEQYRKKVAITALKHVETFVAIPIGAEVNFSLDIESREFNGRWYTSVSCYKWEILQGSQPSQPAPPADDSDLPF